MKRALGLSLAVAFAISVVAAPVMAGDKGNAFGNEIKKDTGCTYGQLWKIAKDDPGHATVKNMGARAFYESDAYAAHAGVCD